jgi:hypothetical protein
MLTPDRPPSDPSDPSTLLQFIQAFEQANPSQSPYVIANRLRGYTKPAYTTRSWTAATGYEQAFITGTLDREVLLGGAAADFAHLIAALSDQIAAPGLNWSQLSRWTADGTSWAGDIGSAIAAFRKTPATPLADWLNRLAGEADYTADVAAWLAGQRINQGTTLSGAIGGLGSASDQARQFLQGRLGGQIQGNRLTNPASVEAAIRRGIFGYMALLPLGTDRARPLQWLGSRFKLMPRADSGSGLSELLQGALHFLHFLVVRGNLEPVQFQPYQVAQMPGLGQTGVVVSA